MAYNFTAASSRYLSTSSAPASGSPMTIAAWIYPTTNANFAICAVTKNNAQDRNQITFNVGAIRAYSQGGSDFALADTTATSSINTWAHACGVFSSSSSRTAYLNGANAVSNTTNVGTQLSATGLQIGARIAANSVGSYFNGNIAEVGIWNTALTAAEIASLAKGMTCHKIRPQSLVFHAPLVRDLIDTKAGLTITNNNSATVADHPRIYG